MKKGISVWSFSGKPLVECFRLAREAGFDGIEVALDEKGEIHCEAAAYHCPLAELRHNPGPARQCQILRSEQSDYSL